MSADFFCPVKKCFEFACEANFRKANISGQLKFNWKEAVGFIWDFDFKMNACISDSTKLSAYYSLEEIFGERYFYLGRLPAKMLRYS